MEAMVDSYIVHTHLYAYSLLSLLCSSVIFEGPVHVVRVQYHAEEDCVITDS